MSAAESCESCGAPGYVVLVDGSVWCLDCDSSARNMGYDDTRIAGFVDRPPSVTGTEEPTE